MTVTISFAASNDGRVRSSSTSYSSASGGSNLDVDTTSTVFGSFGQRLSGSTYNLYQYFTNFPVVLDAQQGVVSAYFEFTPSSNDSGGPSRNLEVRRYAWTPTLTTGNWRSQNGLNALPLIGTVNSVQNASSGTTNKVRCGSDVLIDDYLTSGTTSIPVVCAMNRQRNGNAPTSAEDIAQFYTGNSSFGPRLVYTSVPISTLNRAMSYQVQLSDGSHVYVEHDSAGFSTSKSVKHRTVAGVVTTILNEAVNVRTAVQGYAVVRDSSDNFYVLNVRDVGQTLNCQGYQKGVGDVWTPRGIHTISLSSYPNGRFINIAAAWHPIGTGGGTIVIMAANNAAANSGIPISYALVSPSVLLGGFGSPLRNSGTAAGLLYYIAASTGFNSFPNETSSLLDMCAAPNTTNRGYVVTAASNLALSYEGSPSIARYTLNSIGTGFASVATSLGEGLFGGLVKKDANAKARVIGVSESQFLVITADPRSTSGGLTVNLVQNSGTSNNFNALVHQSLDDEGLTTMLSASAIAVSSTWDAVYDPNTNWVWIYYLDAADSRRLRKLHIDLNTGFSGNEQVTVALNIGPGGSTNLAIRLHRGITIGEQVLVTLANRSSGGTHTTQYVVDSLNAPPFAPTLLTRSNFNAANNATFQWTFNDPNVGDTQSAFQLQISQDGVGIVHDTGKVVSSSTQYILPGGTITNGNSYTWRVQTWDSLDQQGPYSTTLSFSTSVSGILDIVDPAVDNPPGIITKDNLVQWTVTGSTQVGYRVVVRRTDSEALLVDTGWVTSTDTQYLIQNMLSDVEYRIEVTARNASLVETNTAVRLLTASYADAEIPIITLSTQESYVRIDVENPEPQGDRPVPIRNDIYRSGDQGLIFELVGSAELNGSFSDYSVVDGMPYLYFARTVEE